MKILVTGSSGFIGSYLVKRLNELKFDISLCDLSNGIDICNWEEVKKFNNYDIIIHLANLSYVPASYNDPQKFYKVNYLGTLNMLELCRISNARLIYLSSYMYGQPQYQPIDEKHPVQAYNPYSQTKVICESLCEGYNRDFNVPITIFRPFNIYGNGQNPDFLIPSIINQAKIGKIVVKDERPKRDYIHVNDVVDAIIGAIESENKLLTMQILNLGTGKSYSVREIVELVKKHINHSVEYQCTNEFRQNEVLDTIADISNIKKKLNWTPKIGIEQGLKMIINE